jgi:hypothetical protein
MNTPSKPRVATNSVSDGDGWSGLSTTTTSSRLSFSLRLYRECICFTFDRLELVEALGWEVASADFARRLAVSHPSRSSNIAAFVAAETSVEMARSDNVRHRRNSKALFTPETYA